MRPEFSFSVDRAHHVVTATIQGFLGLPDVDAYVAARDAAHRALRCAPNQHLTLVDMRGMAIQPQDTARRFAEVLGASATRSRRLAFVTSKSLARLQVQRTAAGRDVRFFDDPVQARRWLLADEPDAHQHGS